MTGHEAFSPDLHSVIEIANVEVRMIAPAVAAAVVILKVGLFTLPDGVRRPESEDRISLILTKRDRVDELLTAIAQ